MHTKEDPIVYVVHESAGKNITPAFKFGACMFLLPPVGTVSLDMRWSITQLRANLQFARSIDYLLLIGDPVMIGLATAVMAEFTDGKFNILRWDRQEKIYIELAIDLMYDRKGLILQ